jgi:thiamine-monophosphate kinase
MNKENFFINLFHSKYIGDDGAIVNNATKKKLIISSDSFFENIHFKRQWFTLYQIAQKAMLINISDAIVMNAKAKYAILNIAIPPNFTKKQLIELANGFKDTAKKYNIKIIGGDTISNTKLDISITLLSYAKKPIKRTGTKINDLVAYTNNLGEVKKDLDKLLNGKKIKPNSKFIMPKLHPKFFYQISQYISSALDISDGLFFELERLSKANQIGFEFFKHINKDIGCSGEEYEILFCFNQKYKNQILKIAKQHNIKINIIAKVTKGNYKCQCKPHHF